MYEIRLLVAGEAADAEESAELTSRLREELLGLDVDSVTTPSAVAPQGAKGDALAWAQLAVSLSGSLPAVLAAIRSWRGRQRGVTVTVDCAGDRLILSDATPAEQSALVEAWLERNRPG